MYSPVVELQSRPCYEIGDDAGYKNLLGPGFCHNTSRRVDCDAADIAALTSISPVCKPELSGKPICLARPKMPARIALRGRGHRR